MGYPKALLPLGNSTFLIRILDTVQELEMPQPCIVLGADAREIRLSLRNRPVRVLINQDFQQGQLSSIKLALRNLDSSCPGCLIWPVDHPCVSKALVEELIRLFLDTKAPLALPRCGGLRGHPAIFRRVLFQELLDAPMEKGARGVVLHHQGEIALLDTLESATITDIDTPEDYLRLTGETIAAALARKSITSELE